MRLTVDIDGNGVSITAPITEGQVPPLGWVPPIVTQIAAGLGYFGAPSSAWRADGELCYTFVKG